MNNNKNAEGSDTPAERLQEALEQLHKDVVRVEVWAGALSGFTKPVPEYEPNQDFVLKSSEKPAPSKPPEAQ